jgi:hypothetical protein
LVIVSEVLVHNGGKGMVEQSSSHHDSWEAQEEARERYSSQNTAPVTYLFYLATASYFSPPPNNGIIL